VISPDGIRSVALIVFLLWQWIIPLLHYYRDNFKIMLITVSMVLYNVDSICISQ